jgi:hypothetical protein
MTTSPRSINAGFKDVNLHQKNISIVCDDDGIRIEK